MHSLPGYYENIGAIVVGAIQGNIVHVLQSLYNMHCFAFCILHIEL